MRYLDEPHKGACGLLCFGGKPYEEILAEMERTGEDADDYIQRHHAHSTEHPCPHCEEKT